MFFKNFKKICTEASMSIFRNVLDLQNELIDKHLAVSFLNTFSWLLPKIEQKRISSYDKIAWCKNSRLVKYLSNSGSFFYLVSLKTFLLFLRVNFTYF